MSVQIKEPILVIGLGGAGSKLAFQAKEIMRSDCLIVSNDKSDFRDDCQSIPISTDSVVNPSVPLIRGSTYKVANRLKSLISNYSTIFLMTNMAGKGGQAISPVISEICKDSKVSLISFAIMPFKYEKERIFHSGIALKRIRDDSDCTIVLDNDSLLESNPDLTTEECYKIAKSAISHVVKSIRSSEIDIKTNVLTSSKEGKDIEESLRDSLKMLYENAPANSVKRSILYLSGDKIPVGVLNSISSITSGVLKESSAQIDLTNSSEESKVVILSSIQGITKFDKYDPLGMIPQENNLDWSNPDCSIDCKLDLYQLE